MKLLLISFDAMGEQTKAIKKLYISRKVVFMVIENTLESTHFGFMSVYGTTEAVFNTRLKAIMRKVCMELEKVFAQ